MMAINFLETKELIIAAIKRVNNQKPKDFDDAMLKLGDELVMIEDITITNFSIDVMAIKVHNEVIAYVGGLIITGHDYYTLFDDENELMFREDAEVFNEIKPENFYVEKAEECRCICHTKPSKIKHILPCCYTCEYCGKQINSFYFKSHKIHCPSKPKPNSKKARK